MSWVRECGPLVAVAVAVACSGNVRRDSGSTGAAGTAGQVGSAGAHGISVGGGPWPAGGVTGSAGSSSAGSGAAPSEGGTAGAGAGSGGERDGGAGGEGQGAPCAMEDLLFLRSVSDLEAFAARGCEIWDGSLAIESPDLLDLDALAPSSLRTITGTLSIADNPALLDIEGLAGLERIGGSLVVEENQGLVDLDGLSALVSIGTDPSSNSLVISGNPALSSVAALQQAELSLNLYITGNAALQSLAGIRGPARATSITVASNQALSAWSGLAEVESTTSLTIASNPNLASIEMPLFESCDYSSITGNAALTRIDMPSLAIATSSFVIAENAELSSFGELAALTTVGSLVISGNPKLADCAAQALAARLAVSCGCGGNDENAVCD